MGWCRTLRCEADFTAEQHFAAANHAAGIGQASAESTLLPLQATCAE